MSGQRVELGGARQTLPGLGSPQDRLPNPTPKLLSSSQCPSLLPPTLPASQVPARAHVCTDRWGYIFGASDQDVTVSGDGPGQEVRIPFFPEPGDLSDR